MRDYYDYNNPFNDLANVFNNLGDSFVQAFRFEPRFRQTIPAQDVVIEDVIEDETKEDENDGGNLCNRSLILSRML